MVSSLNNFVEQSGSVLNWLRKNLKEVAFLIVIKQDLIFLEPIDIFRYFYGHIRKVLSDTVIIGIRNV